MRNWTHYEARFGAVGGQGVVLAGAILADAAVFYENLKAVTSPQYTAQVRGGATKVDVIIDTQEILFPQTYIIDFFLAMSQRAFDRYVSDTSPDGTILIEPSLVTDYSKAPAKVYAMPIILLTKREVGKMVMTSVVALGAMVAMSKVVSEEAIRKAVLKNAPKGTEQLNLKALALGLEWGNELIKKGPIYRPSKGE
ncbi:MAG: 2-oxoacid:acceptor oxidoreductase family protein [bacterium]|nr:2-oxoacid:acceptor oxidoreductase family protein [bacterium]